MTYDIVVFISKNVHASKDQNKNMTIKDMLGSELEQYYDGWEHGPDGARYFFYKVPQVIMTLTKDRAKKYKDILTLTIKKK